jgi:uncharacterized lipoprotein YmbA
MQFKEMPSKYISALLTVQTVRKIDYLNRSPVVYGTEGKSTVKGNTNPIFIIIVPHSFLRICNC